MTKHFTATQCDLNGSLFIKKLRSSKKVCFVHFSSKYYIQLFSHPCTQWSRDREKKNQLLDEFIEVDRQFAIYKLDEAYTLKDKMKVRRNGRISSERPSM